MTLRRFDREMGRWALAQLPEHRNFNPLVVGSNPTGPTRLDKIKNLHSADSIDTESLSTRGRSVWVHSRLQDSSVPAGEGGAVGNGVARSLCAEPGYAVRS